MPRGVRRRAAWPHCISFSRTLVIPRPRALEAWLEAAGLSLLTLLCTRKHSSRLGGDPMEPRVTPIDATLGAVVTGFALSQMDASAWKTVEQAFHDYAVLVFPGQHLTEDEQVAFANRFGDIELLAPDPEQKAVAISNQKPDGSVMDAHEHRFKSLRGNEGWHTDSSYMPLAMEHDEGEERDHARRRQPGEDGQR